MEHKLEEFFDLLKQLIRVPSVVGCEHPFFIHLKRELEDLGISVEYYDGLLVAKGESPESGYISAHCDRHGLFCTGENEFQYAAFIAKNRADLTGTSNAEKMLKNFTHRFVDEKVQAYEPYSGTYLGMGKIVDAELCERRNNILFKVEGLAHLFPGTPLAFMDRLNIEENTYVSAQLDNVLCVAMIIHLYKLGYQGTAFFTASEEAGKSWRFLIDWFKRYNIETKELLVLDTSPYDTLEDINGLDLILRNRDANATFRSKLKNKIKKILIENSIKYHFKDEYMKNRMIHESGLTLGSTELGRIVKASKGKIQGTTLQVPSISYHTSNEKAKIKSVEDMIFVLQKLYVN